MVQVRPARPADRDALGAIYAHWVRSSAITFDVEPRAGRALEAWFGQFAPEGRHRLLVVEDDAVRGYASSHTFRAKPAYATTVELTIYLHPDRLGRGYGGLLLDALLSAVEEESVHRLVAGVARPNPASERLFRARGFQEVGVFHEVGFKHGRYWDVVWMERAMRST